MTSPTLGSFTWTEGSDAHIPRIHVYTYTIDIYIYTYIHVIYIYVIYNMITIFRKPENAWPKKSWLILQYYFLELLVLPDRLDDTSDPAGFRQPAGKVSIDLRIQRIQVDRSWTLKDITKRIFKVGSLKNLSPTFKSVHVMRGYERNSLSPSVNICQLLHLIYSDNQNVSRRQLDVIAWRLHSVTRRGT